MNEDTNIQKIKKALNKYKKLSKASLCEKTGIHYYLIDTYLDVLLKNNIIREIKNKSGKYTYYELKYIGGLPRKKSAKLSGGLGDEK